MLDPLPQECVHTKTARCVCASGVVTFPMQKFVLKYANILVGEEEKRFRWT